MLATINTDASFSRRNKRGTYAFWSVFNGGTIKRSGILRGKVSDSTEAEIKCILNALYKTLYDEAEITRVIVNTDSMHAIYILEGDQERISKHRIKDREYLRYRFNKIKKEFPCVVNYSFRHVKAHSGIKDARSYVNDWCDAQAKGQMSILIKKIISDKNDKATVHSK
jgi:ribonuclease HI